MGRQNLKAHVSSGGRLLTLLSDLLPCPPGMPPLCWPENLNVSSRPQKQVLILLLQLSPHFAPTPFLSLLPRPLAISFSSSGIQLPLSSLPLAASPTASRRICYHDAKQHSSYSTLTSLLLWLSYRLLVLAQSHYLWQKKRFPLPKKRVRKKWKKREQQFLYLLLGFLLWGMRFLGYSRSSKMCSGE